jgi:glycosyltransferase involved in cell wall biosynthesis
LAKWEEGYDVVYGIRISRKNDNITKRATAGWFYRLFNKISHIKIPENAGDYRLMDRKVVEVVKRFPERNRFMKGLFAWVGFRSIGLPYERPLRSAGQSKWSYWKLWNLALDAFVSFSTVPLRVWTYVGAVVAMLAFLYSLFIATKVLILGVDIPGYASLMVVLLFFGGIQLLSLGVLGEYLGRLFTEVKGRPIYIVENVYEFPTAYLRGSGEADN